MARPLVRYLLGHSNIRIAVADQIQNRAEELIGDHASGTAINMDVRDTAALNQMIAATDIVISLLPWTMHPRIAAFCLEHKKHLVTASYVTDEMLAFHEPAKEKGLLFVNEMGVDPGIDHMAAMKTINKIKGAGGKIISFYSYCGGLPAVAYNNNPLGYKFSWSPEGVLLAAENDGRYLKDGNVVEIPESKLFEHYWLKDIPRIGTFEAYVNRDALPYLDLYGIAKAKNIFRGTLRNIGHCETWNLFKKLGLLNRKVKFDTQNMSPHQVIANIIHSTKKEIKKDVADYLKIPEYSLALKKLEWLGMFRNESLDLGTVSVFELFAHILKHKITYKNGELDMLLQHHEFVTSYPEGKEEMTMATLIDKGTQGGDSSMSKTVGLPVAIAARLIAEDSINLKGVCIPVYSQIYEPVLKELENLNIKLSEKKITL